MRELWLVVMLVICPYCIGKLAVAKIIDSERITNNQLVFPLGFFLELAVFELIAFPCTFFHFYTSSLTVIFTIVILGFSLLGLFKCKIEPATLKKPDGFEWLYIIFFFVLFAWQLKNAVALDFTYMAADDSAYVTWANDAVLTDKMFNVDVNTGVAGPYNTHRIIQTFIVFPAVLSILSGVPVITIEHFVLQVFFLILAYSVYYYMSSVLYESLSNRMIFLALVSLLYIYGFYAEYNTSFRLLMPNYQGKAVLAVSLTPLLFALMIELIQTDFEWKYGWLLLLLSAAAVSLTLIGAVVIVAIVTLTILFSIFSKYRKYNHLIYIPMTAALPLLYVGVFLIYRFAL